MEQRFLRYFLLCSLFFWLSGCRSPEEHPELLDPVYLDLGAESKAATAAVAEEEKAIHDLKAEIKAITPRDIQRRKKYSELSLREKNLVQLRQQAMYFEIRQKQRLEHDRVSYMKAFEAEKPWPDPNEVAEYKTVKQMRGASRNWDKRVPKSNRYTKKDPAEAHPEGARAEGGNEAPKSGH